MHHIAGFGEFKGCIQTCESNLNSLFADRKTRKIGVSVEVRR
jgi:hypothetical protein